MCLKRSKLLSHGPLLQHLHLPLSKAKVTFFKRAMSGSGLEVGSSSGLEENRISGIGGGHRLCLWCRVRGGVHKGWMRRPGMWGTEEEKMGRYTRSREDVRPEHTA